MSIYIHTIDILILITVTELAEHFLILPFLYDQKTDISVRLYTILKNTIVTQF